MSDRDRLGVEGTGVAGEAPKCEDCGRKAAPCVPCKPCDRVTCERCAPSHELHRGVELTAIATAAYPGRVGASPVDTLALLHALMCARRPRVAAPAEEEVDVDEEITRSRKKTTARMIAFAAEKEGAERAAKLARRVNVAVLAIVAGLLALMAVLALGCAAPPVEAAPEGKAASGVLDGGAGHCAACGSQRARLAGPCVIAVCADCGEGVRTP